jgi:hypothetical protein
MSFILIFENYYLNNMLKKLLVISLFLFLFSAVEQAKAIDEYHDLSVKSFTFEPAKPAAGRPVKISVNVYYEGTGISDPDLISDYTYSFLNFTKTNVDLPDISPTHPLTNEGTVSYIFTGEFKEVKDSKLYFRISPSFTLGEAVLSNNDLEASVSVIEQYDLEVVNITIFPNIPAVGQKAVVQVSVKNTGVVGLSRNIGFTHYSMEIDDFDIESTEIPRVDSGHWVNVGDTVDYKFTGEFYNAGEKNMEFNLDTENRLSESNESNNSFTKTIEIVGSENIDFLVEDLVSSRNLEELIVGDNFTATYKVKNNSGFTITTDTGLLLRDYNFVNGGDALLTYSDMDLSDSVTSDLPGPEIHWEPDSYLNYTYTLSAEKPGTGYLKFAIDSKNKVKESDESNNDLSKKYIIYKDQQELDEFVVLDRKIDFYSATSARVTWETSRETDGYIMIRDTDTEQFDRFLLKWGLEEWPNTEDQYIHELNLENLTPGVSYRYQLINRRDDVEKKSSIYEFTMPKQSVINFTKEPVLNLDIDNKTATLTWETNFLSNAKLYYKINTQGDYNILSSNTYALSGAINIKTLSLGTYQYYLVSNLNSGQSITSEFKTFIVPEKQTETETINQEESIASKDDSAQNETDSTIDNTGETDIKANDSTGDIGLYNRLKGKIVIQVEKNGEAYYISPKTQEYYFLGRPEDAFQVMRQQGIGISNQNLYKIPVGVISGGIDSDGDGLPDNLEAALGLNTQSSDTDSDGYYDKDELINGYSPWSKTGKQNIDSNFAKSNTGKIFLQIENNGEAWYLNPGDNKRYFLGRPDDAFSVMRQLGLGISTKDFDKL